MSPTGQPLWGASGVALTFDPGFHASPKIAATSDGNVVVAWTTDSAVVLQKLDPNGHPLWIGQTAFEYGVTLQESGFNYSLADLHAADDGSVIVSWVRNHGFGSNNYLYANKISATGQLLWGSGHVKVFDGGSLQFGEFPYFIPDGSGGAVFSWYSNSPSLQVYAQHILSDGTEAFGHNGSVGSTNQFNVRVSPSASYNPSTQETFLFWTEEDSNQIENGVSGQKFNSAGARQWGDGGLSIVPLGADSQILGGERADRHRRSGLLVRSAGLRLRNHPGDQARRSRQLRVSRNSRCRRRRRTSRGWRPASRLPGLAALTWEDDRNGENDIYIQNVNPDCTLGIAPPLQLRR